MEVKEAVTPIVAPRTENTIQFGGPTLQAAVALPATGAPPPVVVAAPPGTVMSGAGTGSDGKKKRGRPRKYGPNPNGAAMPLSPMPISSIPVTVEYSAWKRGRGKPVAMDTVKKSHKYEFGNSGDRIAYFVGANFTPHVITVNAGEDVTMKIMSFSQQQGSRAICILSANGTISNVTLRQPTSSGGTLTYEGIFEILSLSGSFMSTENGGTKSRSGGMSVSLAGPDGRVLGGGLAGFLIASGPVQVVIGSFIPGQQQEPKKPRTEPTPIVTHATVTTITAEELYGSAKPILSSTLSFNGNNAASLNPMQQGIMNSGTDTKSSSRDEDSRDYSLSNCDVSS